MKVVQHIKQTTSALVHSAEENRDECKIQIRQTGNNMMSSKQGWMKKIKKEENGQLSFCWESAASYLNSYSKVLDKLSKANIYSEVTIG